jgi:hypothetical protein
VPQIPDWKQQAAAWKGAAESFVSDVAARGRRLPDNVVSEFRRRVNVLGLATREDVAMQHRLARRRMTVALKEFSDAQRNHDQQLIETLRIELRDELQSLVSALDDDVFVEDPIEALDARTRRARSELDDLDDPDDLDLLALDDLSVDDGEITLRWHNYE